jgi:hypothetical protein
MSQSRRMSAVETLAGVAIGFVVSVAASFVVYPLFGHSFTLSQNICITIIFTVLSILRGYVVRRAFNYWSNKA